MFFAGAFKKLGRRRKYSSNVLLHVNSSKRHRHPMRGSQRLFIAVACVLTLGAKSLHAKVDATADIQTTTIAATQSGYAIAGESYTYGNGRDLKVTGVTTVSGVSFVVLDDESRVVARTLDNAYVAGGLRSKMFAQISASGLGDHNYSASYPATDEGAFDVTQLLGGTIINRGVLDVFLNAPNGNNEKPGNIERVDFIYDRGVTTPAEASLLSEGGHIYIEKNANNPAQVAAILELDLYGNPSRFGPLLNIRKIDMQDATIDGQPKTFSWSFLTDQSPIGKSAATGGDIYSLGNDPAISSNLQEPLGGAVMTFADLGLISSQIYFGVAYFDGDIKQSDVDSGTTDLVSMKGFNTNTVGATGGADFGGGLGGVLMSVEAVAAVVLDTDRDGVGDIDDLDDDNDGLPDLVEDLIDTDNDGIVDSLDKDSDNDGISDTAEAGGKDADRDGRLDNFTDVNGDGLDDTVAVSALPLLDTDNDAIPDYLDLDSDNDSLSDNLEAGGLDINGDGIVDSFEDKNGDGLDDSIRAQPLPITDTDADGTPDHIDFDSDNDGLSDLIEVSTQAGTNTAVTVRDTDGDSVPDYLDLDSDNDNIPDSVEGNGDVDGDGIADYRDSNADEDSGVDSDGDGISDSIEGDIDSDGDGVVDSLDLDSDNDGINDSIESTVDTDADGVFDRLDLDSDNDGLFDLLETYQVDQNNDGRIDGFVDVNNDGMDDNRTASLQSIPDTDADGTPDFQEIDSDADGISDSQEGLRDSDFDGVPNYRDSDSDGDGISDAREAGASGVVPVDSDADGIPDYLDQDSDNDGIDDSIEAGDSSAGRYDIDGDGIANAIDTDSDGDGIDDIVEGGRDSDADGVIDSMDIDSDNDGLLDKDEGATDTDGDGVMDYLDLDSDNDGLTDHYESSGNDRDGDGRVDGFTDMDGDGAHDVLVLAPLTPLDTDKDLIRNHLDLDSDNDGLLDLIESGAFAIDQNGDGRVDGFVDSNQNGLDDALEAFPVNVIDTDGDRISDHLDLDSDNNGEFDLSTYGAIDINNDGVVDSMIDSDQDGIPDSVDVSSSNGTDADADGIDDLADVDFNDEPDGDNDGIIDSADPDIDGDGLANSSDDTPMGRELNSATAAIESAAIGVYTGLDGGGCSVSATREGKLDPSLLILCLIALGYGLRRVNIFTRR